MTNTGTNNVYECAHCGYRLHDINQFCPKCTSTNKFDCHYNPAATDLLRAEIAIKDAEIAKLKQECATAKQVIADNEARIVRLCEALTPSAETKAAYMEEIVLETVSDGLPVSVTRYVPWTAVKDIMRMIGQRALR